MRLKQTIKIGAAITAMFLLAATLTVDRANAQTFTVLHTFHYTDGWSPAGQLVLDSDGNIYGTASGGGHPKCPLYETGCGTVFKLNENGKQTWVHSFNGKNGLSPLAGVFRDKEGDLYGTTGQGGKSTDNCGIYGCGVAFRLDQTGMKESVLHKFSSDFDGYFPEALLVGDPAGNLYGTTYESPSGFGTVFKLSEARHETILHYFHNDGDGANPHTGVIRDATGNLYGVTFAGGETGGGTVYRVVDTTGHETVLYSFTCGSDGCEPNSVLLEDAAGNLYGTTQEGGDEQCTGGYGCGVVFELSPHGSYWTESVLYTFCSQSECADGAVPLWGPLVQDAAGNLYGTTTFGGTSQCDGVDEGCGVVFKLDTAGNETVLHTFSGGADGAYPVAGLTMDASGNLYGTAQAGGDLNCQPKYHGCGVVFKIVP
jgi:uncharacterized repeat protein (TIGR03803 family)